MQCHRSLFLHSIITRMAGVLVELTKTHAHTFYGVMCHVLVELRMTGVLVELCPFESAPAQIIKNGNTAKKFQTINV